ncbi:TetR family transcriptional regulator [Nonomuraea sp. NPDC050556]|uniref:TetR/AcrR family transcriptional regulator n=1 Tax=Nonomuraea sp. NPDC050556 TaxID=3364369 RepID=UPI00379F2CEA
MSEERGRRPGNPQTKDEILEAAIAAFTTQGYAKTTIRGVARAAAVDPALVMHFYGNKDGLFDAAMRGGGMPVNLLLDVIQGDPATLGERLSSRYLSLWEHPLIGRRMSVVMQAATSSPAAADMLREFMTEVVLKPVTEQIQADHPETRALLAASQMIGLAMIRYILRIEPLASLPMEQVAAAVAPNLQRYLTGTLTLDELPR